MSYEPGARTGKYEVRRKLGQGAMGEVYVAWDTVLERHAGHRHVPQFDPENTRASSPR